MSSLVRRRESFCWVLPGLSPDSLMLFAGRTSVSVVNLRTPASRSRQNSGMSRPGCCFVLFFGPGIASRPSSLAWFRAWISVRSASRACAGQIVPGQVSAQSRRSRSRCQPRAWWPEMVFHVAWK